MAADVRAGLTSPFKELSPRYFYDERGSELFEQITELEEYYPTRCEREILQTRSADICEAANRPASLIELGSGSARQDPRPPRRDEERRAASRPTARSTSPRRSPATRRSGSPASTKRSTFAAWSATSSSTSSACPVGGPRVIALLGGTIGNFAPHQRAGFLRRIANLLDPEDRFLLGTDLVKDPAVLEAAYNDSKGVTAEFNKNVLSVLNRELERRLRHGLLRARRPLGPREPLGRHPAALHGEPGRQRSALDMLRPLRRRRGDAHRDLDQVPAPGPRGDLRRGRPRADRLVDGLARASTRSRSHESPPCNTRSRDPWARRIPVARRRLTFNE